jgi:hypothetical protein
MKFVGSTSPATAHYLEAAIRAAMTRRNLKTDSRESTLDTVAGNHLLGRLWHLNDAALEAQGVYLWGLLKPKVRGKCRLEFAIVTGVPASDEPLIDHALNTLAKGPGEIPEPLYWGFAESRDYAIAAFARVDVPPGPVSSKP